MYHKCFYSHNFGHNGPLDFYGLGINGKISELQAAMGLSVLPYMDTISISRSKVVDFYDNNLNWGILEKMIIRQNTTWNYSYYPILFSSEQELLFVQKKLNDQGIFPRRYFYPSLNTVKFSRQANMIISEDVVKRILCLPLYDSLKINELEKIVSLI